MSDGMPTTGMLDGPVGLSTDGLLFLSAPYLLSEVTPSTIPDDGGTLMSAEAPWPTDQGVYVWVDLGDGTPLIPCYSGVVGAGNVCTAVGTTLEWVSPPLPIGGPYTLVYESEDGITFEGEFSELMVVHRSFTTRLYSLRSAMPPPRAVGAYDIRDEE